MSVEEKEEYKDEENEEETIFDLEVELISVLSDLNLARKKNKILKEETRQLK